MRRITTLLTSGAVVGACGIGAAQAAAGTGTTTSPAAPVTPTIQITEARQVSTGKIALRGTISPIASLKGGAASLILYRQTKAGPQQLSFNGAQTRPNQKTGAFLMTATGEPAGRNKYILQYVPSAVGYAPQVVVTRTIRVR